MEARVIKLQDTADSYEAKLKQFEAIREEASRLEFEKRRQERIDSLILKIPMRFRYKRFHDYEAEHVEQIRVKNIAMRYAMGFKEVLSQGGCLIFRGKPGTGKTLLSLIMYQEIGKQGFNVRYESTLDFVSELLIHKFKSESSYQGLIKSFEDVDFLILDEVTESINKGGLPSDIEKQVLFNLINKRYEKKLCTLVITNRQQNDLVNRLGVPSIDRLLEQGMSLTFDWNSYRQK